MKKIFIIALFIFLAVILTIEIFILTSTRASNAVEQKNNEFLIESYNYYTSMKRPDDKKEIEKNIKILNDKKEEEKIIQENKVYEAANLFTSEKYNEFLDSFLADIKHNNSKNSFRQIGNYEYITNYRIINDNLALVLTDKNIYLKNGEKWEYVSLKGLNKTLYFTSGEIFNFNDESYIIVGTSYSGIFYKNVKNKFLKQFNSGIQSQYATDIKLSFYESISSIYSDNKNIFIGYSFSKGIDILSIEDLINSKKPSFKRTDIIPIEDVSESIESFSNIDGVLYANSNYAVYKYNSTDSSWIVYKKKINDSYSKKTSTNGLYLNPYAISSEKKIDNYIAMCNEFGLNTFVVDFKDDFGHLTYSSEIEFAKKIGAVKKIIDIDSLAEKCKANNIKIVARIVTFKDEYAYGYNNNEMALWDWKNKKPWEGLKGDKWIDPYNEDYHKYLIEIGKELEQKGADEIQYDYVRFPSDGEIYNISYRFRKNGTSKNFILYNFFVNANREINIPVSADFYGYNCWYLISANVGQDISLISRAIDVVYPMFYPSHFVDGFYQKNLGQYDRNFDLYYHGVIRTYKNADYRLEVRPWIQTFKIKVNIALKDYIKAQIEGLKKAGIDSYIFWSPSSNYQMLYDVFEKK